MTKATMIKWYRRKSVAEGYILGFVKDHMVYFVELEELMPRMIAQGHGSRNRGQDLRMRVKKAHKEQLMKKNPVCLGTETILIDEKWNRGQMFEKIITEYYGQTWTVDKVPFWIDGDITLNGKKIQIKFENASLTNESQINKKFKGM